MSNIVISVENLSKSYRLGQIGTGTLSRDLNVWWAKVRGKPNPLLKIGQTDHGNQDGETLWALKDVSFQVQQGEVLGIIGRNGAGKSTLLKILSRVTAPTSGQVKVKGRIASLLEVGTGFHPELTGRENIFLNGAILGMSRQEVQRKFDEIVSFAEVEKFVDTPVKRYSSGMHVRLGFAVAAHLESEILIVDEVLAVGDAEFQKKCLGKMGDVAGEGRTVLFVSHNMGAVSELCNRSILLDRGVLIHDGITHDVVTYYLQANSQTGIVDLRTWTLERTGEGPIRVVAAYTLGENATVQSVFGWKEQFILRFLVQSDQEREAIIRVGIRDWSGKMVLNFCNVDDDMAIRIPAGQSAIEVVPETNWLNDGDYFISIQVDDSIGNLNDRVGNCIKFSIDSSAQGVCRTEGIFRIPAHWRKEKVLMNDNRSGLARISFTNGGKF